MNFTSISSKIELMLLSPAFNLWCFNSWTFKKYFIYLFLEKGREKERERKINVCLPLTYPLLGTWPATQACVLDWESNQQPFGLQASTQSTEPHQPGLWTCSVFCNHPCANAPFSFNYIWLQCDRPDRLQSGPLSDRPTLFKRKINVLIWNVLLFKYWLTSSKAHTNNSGLVQRFWIYKLCFKFCHSTWGLQEFSAVLYIVRAPGFCGLGVPPISYALQNLTLLLASLSTFKLLQIILNSH